MKNSKLYVQCFVNEKFMVAKLFSEKQSKYSKKKLKSLKSKVLKEEYKLYPKSIIKILSNY